MLLAEFRLQGRGGRCGAGKGYYRAGLLSKSSGIVPRPLHDYIQVRMKNGLNYLSPRE